MRGINNPLEVPHTDYIADVAHEWDYESEDMDVQPETFKTQHFKKKGPYFIWVFLGTASIWFTLGELVWQNWADEDNNRYQRPPPLNYPDEDETPDTDMYESFQTKEYRYLYEAGQLKPP